MHLRAAVATVVALSGCGKIAALPYRAKERHWACPAIEQPAKEVGVITDSASVLAASEVRVAAELSRSRFASEAREDDEGPVAFTPQLGVHYGGDHLAVHVDWNPTVVDRKSASPLWSMGNTRVGLGYRTFARQLGGLYRRALGVRSTLGIDVFDDEDDVAVSADLADRRVFDHNRFMPGQYFELRAEARYEFMGCHAPFVHVEGGYTASRDRQDNAIPFGVTVGAHANPGRGWNMPAVWTPSLGYHVSIGHVRRGDTEDWDHSHRLRMGLRFEGDSPVAWDLNYTALMGPVQGYVWTLAATMPLNLGRDP